MAQEAPPSCDERVHDCEELLKKADALIESKKQIISKQDEAIAKQLEIFKAQEDYTHEVEKQRDAWYRNPYVTIPIGLIVGGFIVYEVRK